MHPSRLARSADRISTLFSLFFLFFSIFCPFFSVVKADMDDSVFPHADLLSGELPAKTGPDPHLTPRRHVGQHPPSPSPEGAQIGQSQGPGIRGRSRGDTVLSHHTRWQAWPSCFQIHSDSLNCYSKGPGLESK